LRDENGYELWLRYSPLSNEAAKKDLTRAFGLIFFPPALPPACPPPAMSSAGG
jgi:alpha-glucuronidase